MVLRNKHPRVASTYTDRITVRDSCLHWRTPNQTRKQLLFYSIRV